MRDNAIPSPIFTNTFHVNKTEEHLVGGYSDMYLSNKCAVFEQCIIQ